VCAARRGGGAGSPRTPGEEGAGSHARAGRGRASDPASAPGKEGTGCRACVGEEGVDREGEREECREGGRRGRGGGEWERLRAGGGGCGEEGVVGFVG
jgi:hypothetical protein